MKAGKKVYANVKYLGMIVFYTYFIDFLQNTPPPQFSSTVDRMIHETTNQQSVA